MRKIDHIAITVDNPIDACQWYEANFGAHIIYSDETWGIVELENIKLAFVMKDMHPPHFAFEVESFEESDVVKQHRDGSVSAYKKDPWGNIYELIKYPKIINTY